MFTVKASFKIGSFKAFALIIKKIDYLSCAIGMHLETMGEPSTTCGNPATDWTSLFSFVDLSSSRKAFGWNAHETSCEYGHMWRS